MVIRRKRIVYIFLAVLITMIFHEFGHYLTGNLLGNSMEMDLNGTRPVHGEFIEEWHLPVVAIFGTIFTLFQAFLFWILLNVYQTKNLYPFLFFPFIYRVVPYIISLIQPERLGRQDKVQFAQYFNFNPWLIIIPVLIVFYILVYTGGKIIDINYKQIGFYTVTSIISAILIIVFNQTVIIN